MSNVVVLGDTGMLGGMVKSVFKKIEGYAVFGINRKHLDLVPLPLNDIGAALSSVIPSKTDWIINCLGATKPYFNNSSDLSIPIYANSLFPHQLAQWANLIPEDIKVIHITTDCVFDGTSGPYDELDVHTPRDYYGKSKSLGEPSNCMVLRTSIIGPEFGSNKKHFLSWVKSLDGNAETAKGFTNHLWNGLTTLELSYMLAEIINGELYDEQVFHLHSTDVSKFDMVKSIATYYGLDISIEAVLANPSIDRRLRSIAPLNEEISPHSFSDMIKELAEWEYNEKMIGKLELS